MRSWKAWQLVCGIGGYCMKIPSFVIPAQIPSLNWKWGSWTTFWVLNKNPILQQQQPIQSPCRHRGFLFLQPPSTSPKRPPIPGAIAHHCRQALAVFHASVNLKYLQPRQSLSSLFSSSIDASISSVQLANTSLPIAITDTIGSSKAHRHVIPLVRDLIEAA
jgi:hypothetical protein